MSAATAAPGRRKPAPLIALIALLALLSLSLIATGCGRRPAALEAPQGEAADTFPRTYPPPW